MSQNSFLGKPLVFHIYVSLPWNPYSPSKLVRGQASQAGADRHGRRKLRGVGAVVPGVPRSHGGGQREEFRVGHRPEELQGAQRVLCVETRWNFVILAGPSSSKWPFWLQWPIQHKPGDKVKGADWLAHTCIVPPSIQEKCWRNMQYYFLDVTCRNFVIDVQPKNLHTIPNWGWRVFYGPGMVQCMTHRLGTPIPIWNTPIVWSLCDFTTTMERGSWGFHDSKMVLSVGFTNTVAYHLGMFNSQFMVLRMVCWWVSYIIVKIFDKHRVYLTFIVFSWVVLFL